MNPTDTLFVAGHRGMVGSAIVRRLQTLGCTNILTAGRDELDLTDQHAVNAFFAAHRIDAQAHVDAGQALRDRVPDGPGRRGTGGVSGAVRHQHQIGRRFAPEGGPGHRPPCRLSSGARSARR